MIAILYFLTIYGLEKLGVSTIWKASVRGLIADYAYPVGFCHFRYVSFLLRSPSCPRLLAQLPC
jgi:hypothetical protein